MNFISQLESDLTLPALFKTNTSRLVVNVILFLVLAIVFVFVLPYFLSITFLGLATYWGYVLIKAYGVEILLEEDGLIYTKHDKTRQFLWNETDEVATTDVDWRMPVNMGLFSEQSGLKIFTVRIVDSHGNMLILDRTIANVEEMEKLIQRKVAEAKLPRCVAALQRGQSLAFGSLTLTANGVTDGHQSFRWDEFDNVQAHTNIWIGGKTKIEIQKKGEAALTAIADLRSWREAVLLVPLIARMNEQAQKPPFS